VIRSLWAVVQGDPKFMRRLNGWLTVFWTAAIPVSYEMGWLQSVAFVSALSLWALVSGHWAAWQAARVEVAQQEQDSMLRDLLGRLEERLATSTAGEVVERLVEETNVEPSG
jgi:hypothetical protein